MELKQKRIRKKKPKQETNQHKKFLGNSVDSGNLCISNPLMKYCTISWKVSWSELWSYFYRCEPKYTRLRHDMIDIIAVCNAVFRFTTSYIMKTLLIKLFTETLAIKSWSCPKMHQNF